MVAASARLQHSGWSGFQRRKLPRQSAPRNTSATWATPRSIWKMIRDRCDFKSPLVWARLACQSARSEQTLRSHHMHNQNALAVKAIEHSAGRFCNLPIAPSSTQLGGSTPALRVVCQLTHMGVHAFNQGNSRCRVLNCDVISDGLKVGQGWLGPDYFSHRDRRDLASAWAITRPSETAISPLAIPSRIDMRCCCNS